MTNLLDVLRDEVHTYPGQGEGQWAYRDLGGFFPAEARDGTLWPPRPLRRWWQHAVMLLQESVAHLRRNKALAQDLHAQRLLWRRHPWMRTGDIWWRPWWPEPNMAVTGMHETIDPSNGLHRWKVLDGAPGDFALDVERYYVAVLRRNVR